MPDTAPSSSFKASIALIAFVALSVGLITAVLRTADVPAIQGLLWPDPPQISAFSLGSDKGRISEETLKGRWTLLFFGFTHCPDVCPSTLATLKQVAARLAENKTFADHGQVLFVSVDPARDTPTALAEYVHYFDPRFLAATGTDAELNALTGPLGVIHAQVPTGNGDYSIDHTASIFLVDPQLRVLGKFGLPHDAATISNGFTAISDLGRAHP
jgi:protein SCO1/2